VRRLVLLVSAIVLVDTVFFAALAPLLPSYEDEFGLSKQGAGLLTAIYAAGGLAGAIPGGLLASRLGVKPTVLIGLGLMVVTSVAFGLANSVWVLDAARFGQGFGSAVSWTGALAWLVAAAPRERRGELLGIAMGSAVGGALLGPVLGGAGARFGTEVAFGAVAALGLVLIVWAWATPAFPPGDPQKLRRLAGAIRQSRVAGGFWLVTLAAILLGVISVLAPLRLDELGWGALGISVAFLVAAGVEAVANPFLGRWSDRYGFFVPVRAGLVGSIAASLVLPWADERWTARVLVILAGIAYGVFWVPGTALLSHGVEEAGLDQGLGFTLLNMAWAPGNVVGALVAGSLADVTSDAVVYILAAGLCGLTLLALGRIAERPPAGTRPAQDAARQAASAPAE
jgi:MFS family permease